MDPALLIGLDSGIDSNIIKMLVDELGNPIPEVSTERNERPKNENYAECIVPLYSNNLFKEHFRMSRISFEILINKIGSCMLSGHNNPVNLNKKVLFSVWILAKQESFLSVGDRFGIAKSTGHQIFRQIMEVLSNLLGEFIKWPGHENYCAIADIFKKRSHGFPGVIGAIDGCHIACRQPTQNPTDYYNRKGFHSLILQGVCDEKMKFTDVFIGLPGRIHDARVFRNSPLYHHLMSGNLVSSEYHIIGDTAYPLLKTLMTPIRDNGHLSTVQIRYNTKLSSIRSTIERAFALLKNKFRRLKYLDITDLDLGNKMIASCCVLHNFMINENEIENGEADVEFEDDIENRLENENENDVSSNGTIKRNYIILLL